MYESVLVVVSPPYAKLTTAAGSTARTNGQAGSPREESRLCGMASRRLASLAKTQGVKTLVGLQARTTPFILKVKEIIDSGALGRIITTNLVGSTGLFQKLPAKYAYANDPNSGRRFPVPIEKPSSHPNIQARISPQSSYATPSTPSASFSVNLPLCLQP